MSRTLKWIHSSTPRRKRDSFLEKYIHRYTGWNIKVYPQNWIKGGYGAIIHANKKWLKIRKDNKNSKLLIWHEMGHLMAYSNKSRVYNEAVAQIATICHLKKLGFKRLYQAQIDDVKNEWSIPDDRIDQPLLYVEASKLILKYLKRRKMI